MVKPTYWPSEQGNFGSNNGILVKGGYTDGQQFPESGSPLPPPSGAASSIPAGIDSELGGGGTLCDDTGSGIVQYRLEAKYDGDGNHIGTQPVDLAGNPYTPVNPVPCAQAFSTADLEPVTMCFEDSVTPLTKYTRTKFYDTATENMVFEKWFDSLGEEIAQPANYQSCGKASETNPEYTTSYATFTAAATIPAGAKSVTIANMSMTDTITVNGDAVKPQRIPTWPAPDNGTLNEFVIDGSGTISVEAVIVR